MHYAGVGSRKTPQSICKFMYEIGAYMGMNNHILRSGHADGADKSFEFGCRSASGDMEIFLAKHATVEAIEFAKPFHPAWHRLKPFIRKLMGRNVFQILGHSMNNPVDFVICWTPDGCICHADRNIRTGGTGMAISIASTYGVPVYNLARPAHHKLWFDKIHT
jgi:hypothetical protein